MRRGGRGHSFAWRPSGPGFTFPRPAETANCIDAEMEHPELPSPQDRAFSVHKVSYKRSA